MTPIIRTENDFQPLIEPTNKITKMNSADSLNQLIHTQLQNNSSEVLNVQEQ